MGAPASAIDWTMLRFHTATLVMIALQITNTAVGKGTSGQSDDWGKCGVLGEPRMKMRRDWRRFSIAGS